MRNFLLTIIVVFSLEVSGQESHGRFWANWYVQAGLDMSLQKPYGYDFSKVFPNGKTFGVDAAIGKWYTPALGLRAKLNWENGIGIFRNDHANWLAPMFKPGVNMDRGGYLTMVGDVQLDLHNLICGYDADRMWNAQVFVRAGGVYNFGSEKGSPLLGIGIGSTFRLSDRWSLYADAAYQGVSSGHTGNEAYTGVGTGSNGFFDFNIGAQYTLGAQTKGDGADVGFREGWYAQAGLDMTLQKPYGKPMGDVFPKGDSFGINAAIGKHFSPYIGLRLHLNWENGLIENKSLEWIAPSEDGKSSYSCGGYVMATLDVPVSVTNIVMGDDADRKWDGYVFARAGLAYTMSLKATAPVVGGGIGVSRRISDRCSLFGEYGLQTSTSDFYTGVSMTGKSSTGFNCFMTFEAGVSVKISE